MTTLATRDVNFRCPLAALPVALPVARAAGNGQRNANALFRLGTTGNATPTLFKKLEQRATQRQRYFKSVYRFSIQFRF